MYLPEVLFSIIGEYLDNRDIFACRATCRFFKDIFIVREVTTGTSIFDPNIFELNRSFPDLHVINARFQWQEIENLYGNLTGLFYDNTLEILNIIINGHSDALYLFGFSAKIVNISYNVDGTRACYKPYICSVLQNVKHIEFKCNVVIDYIYFYHFGRDIETCYFRIYSSAGICVPFASDISISNRMIVTRRMPRNNTYILRKLYELSNKTFLTSCPYIEDISKISISLYIISQPYKNIYKMLIDMFDQLALDLNTNTLM